MPTLSVDGGSVPELRGAARAWASFTLVQGQLQDGRLRARSRSAVPGMAPAALAELPPEQEAELPSGPERLFFRFQHLIAYQRPAGATGYRIGTMRTSSRVMRFWPPASSRPLAVYSLEPFELFSVPLVGRYALLYFGGNGEHLGHPRFTILVEHRNRELRFSDGDRSPRPRRSHAQEP